MIWGMSFDEVEYGDLHQDCLAKEDALRYVIENEWENAEEIFLEQRGQAWLSRSKPCLNLLSAVSERDRAHLRGGLKRILRRGKAKHEEDVTEEQLFAIASDVCSFLEHLSPSPNSPAFLQRLSGGNYLLGAEPSPGTCIAMTAADCDLGGKLGWAKEVLSVTRAFRDLISVLADPDPREPYSQSQIRQSLALLNSFLTRVPSMLLVHWASPGKTPAFGRCPDPQIADLPAYLAEWVSDYLMNYFPLVGLGVCAECGKFFSRERRDKTFCSKTCQNRVAYRRKKILDSDALEAVHVSPDDAPTISTGWWMHHPRFGIGLIESVSSDHKPVSGFKDLLKEPQQARYASMLARKILVQVRFLHGIRIMGFSDLFEPQKKEDQLPDFYRVRSEETLAELL
jgi:hypothetical protein